jgi:hypothetical protein
MYGFTQTITSVGPDEDEPAALEAAREGPTKGTEASDGRAKANTTSNGIERACKRSLPALLAVHRGLRICLSHNPRNAAIAP